MAENALTFDFNETTFSCSREEAMEHFKKAAVPQQIPAEPDETPQQRSERLAEQHKEQERARAKARFYMAAQKYPEFSTKLYNIREAARNDTPPTSVVNLKVDEKGSPYAQIIMKMEGGFFDFSIHDGKVVFGPMDDAKMAEALDFLYRRGITNFELPAGVDKNFAETYKEAKRQADNNSAQTRSQENDAMAAASQTRQTSQNNQTQTEPDNAPFNWTPVTWENPNPPVKKATDPVKEFTSWLEDKQGKKDYGYHVSGNTIYVYEDNNNPKNHEKNGMYDKNGVLQEKGLMYTVRLNKDSNGQLSGFDYYVPRSGKVPDPLADQMAAMIKAQGALYMDFGKTPTPADAGVFRMACARVGIIPRGIGITKIHANKMLTEAENNIQDEKELYKFKGNLGRQLLVLGKNDVNDPRYKLAQSLINQEKLYPLKLQLEGCLTDRLTERINGQKAEEVIGAANTMKQIFTTISENPSMSLSELCQKLSAETKDPALKNSLMQSLQDVGATGKTAASLDNTQMLALFDTLEAKNIELARQSLVKAINKNRSRDSEDTIVEREVNNASKALNVTLNKTLKDKGFKEGFNTIDFGRPEFEIPTNNNQNTPQPRRQGGR